LKMARKLCRRCMGCHMDQVGGIRSHHTLCLPRELTQPLKTTQLLHEVIKTTTCRFSPGQDDPTQEILRGEVRPSNVISYVAGCPGIGKKSRGGLISFIRIIFLVREDALEDAGEDALESVLSLVVWMVYRPRSVYRHHLPISNSPCSLFYRLQHVVEMNLYVASERAHGSHVRRFKCPTKMADVHSVSPGHAAWRLYRESAIISIDRNG
jgi:hypothetical protein